MTATAAPTVKYRPTGRDGEYAVELRVPRKGARTVGRVARLGNRWHALGTGAEAWTPYLGTRAECAEWLRHRAENPGLAAVQAQAWADRVLHSAPGEFGGGDYLWAGAIASEARRLASLARPAETKGTVLIRGRR